MNCLSTTHTPTFKYVRSTSSVTSDLWEMGFNDVPNNYQSVLDDVQHNDQTTRSTSNVTSDLWEIGLNCQRTPQSTSHFSRLPWQSPIHPSTQTTELPDCSLTYVSDLPCLTYMSDLRVRATCPTYVRSMWLAYVSTLRVQLSDHIIILIIYLR